MYVIVPVLVLESHGWKLKEMNVKSLGRQKVKSPRRVAEGGIGANCHCRDSKRVP